MKNNTKTLKNFIRMPVKYNILFFLSLELCEYLSSSDPDLFLSSSWK